MPRSFNIQNKIGLLGACLALAGADAQAGPPWRVDGGFPTNWSTLTVETRTLGQNLHFLHASGGNSLALSGPDGTVLVDPELAPAAPRLLAALQKIGADDVRFVIDTHYHSDHSGGNAFFRRRGAIVIAQASARARIAAGGHSIYWNQTSPPGAPDALPTLTFDRRIDLHVNGEDITIFHDDPSHTDTDSIVYFHHANVVHMGDVFLTRLYPYVDVPAKGTIDGYFPVLDRVLAMIDDRTIVIPGHGTPSNKAGLQAWRDMLKIVRDRVAGRIVEGQSLQQILAAHPSCEYDDLWASNRVGPDDFVVMIYQSLTGKRLDWQPKR
jgi:cyclase